MLRKRWADRADLNRCTWCEFSARLFASEPLFMRAGQPKMPDCRAVGAQLLSHQQFRGKALLFEPLAHQPERCARVAAALNEHIKDLALVVDGTPQIHRSARDPNHHFVEMPSVARPRPALPQFA